MIEPSLKSEITVQLRDESLYYLQPVQSDIENFLDMYQVLIGLVALNQTLDTASANS